MTTFGNKFNRSVRRFGAKLDKGAHRLGVKTHSVLNRLDKGIGKGDVILRKADNTMKRISTMADLVPTPLNPLIKSVGVGLHTAHELSKNAKKASSSARGHASDLEKFNSRKYAEEALDNSTYDGFA